MVPSRINGQRILSRNSWKEIMAEINTYWEQDYYVTDFDYGGGRYVVVLSKNTGWDGQKIVWDKTFPEKAVDEAWEQGLYITGVTYDGSDWIVVMSGVRECLQQGWFTRTNWRNFLDTISQKWDKDEIITTIGCKKNGSDVVYCGVSSKMSYSGSQGYKSVRPADILSALQELSNGSRIVTDLYDVDGAILAISEDVPGWSHQIFYTCPDFGVLSQAVDRVYQQDYYITALCYCLGGWVLVASR